MRYVGRFAPSPTGPLHAGSLVAALGSWLDARAAGGTWRVRLEDVDTPRCVDGAAERILDQLQRCGLSIDGAVMRQSQRGAAYAAALAALRAQRAVYACGCTRREIDAALGAAGFAHSRHGERVYPGTCRAGLNGKPARAWRLDTQAAGIVRWHDRRLGDQVQDVAAEVGDFVLQRADGLTAYQLAVVVDDAEQGIGDVVRGEDLADNTGRQIVLQRALGVPTPRYLHLPLVMGDDGEKLSKQNGAMAVDLADPLAALRSAGAVLGIAVEASTSADWLARAVERWRACWSTVA